MPILKLRDANGNNIPIVSIRGESAYEQAKAGGYMGTEEEFIAFLNGLLAPVSVVSEEPSHYTDYNNPHKVTAEQVGAVPKEGGTISGDVNIYGGEFCPTLKVGNGAPDTASFIYTPNKTVDIYNWTNGQPTTISLGNYNSMPLKDVLKLWIGANDYQIYGDHNADALGIAKIATGSYVGTGTGGQNNPNMLTFPFQPKVVFISLKGQTNRCDATLPLMYGSGIGLVYSATSSNWATHSTYPINLVWEGKNLSWTYTLNTTSADQKQLNISDSTYDWVAWG